MDEASEPLQETRLLQVPWKQREPYQSHRQWGTVREDYKESLFGLNNGVANLGEIVRRA